MLMLFITKLMKTRKSLLEEAYITLWQTQHTPSNID
jgi:hypothetical protein